jgi:hypothetical protein
MRDHSVYTCCATPSTHAYLIFSLVISTSSLAATTPDARVELEIRTADEALLAHRFETLHP